MNIRKTTLKVLVGTLIVVILIFAGSFYYYSTLNSAVDPRVIEAKHLQLKYEKGLEADQFGEAMILLNSMLDIYQGVPGYNNSYEVGVILNNQASVYLVKLETELLTLEESKIDKEEMQKTLKMAMGLTFEAIDIYENWLKEMGQLTEVEVREKITPYFDPKDEAFKDIKYSMVFDKRVEDIISAQVETTRRLSVSYTNLGVMNRYTGNLQESKANYEKALELWDRNYTAKDNLNTLMNLPVEKRGMLERIFPPERLEELGINKKEEEKQEEKK